VTRKQRPIAVIEILAIIFIFVGSFLIGYASRARLSYQRRIHYLRYAPYVRN